MNSVVSKLINMFPSYVSNLTITFESYFWNVSKRNANVYSVGITKVYTLDRTAYINLIGSLSETEEMDCSEETPVPRESTILQQRASIASFRWVFIGWY